MTMIRINRTAPGLTHMSLATFCGTWANSGDPDQTPQYAASGQGLHWMLTECSIQILIKKEKYPQQPLEGKCAGPIDKSGKFHKA